MPEKNIKCINCEHGSHLIQGQVSYYFKKAIKEKNGRVIEIDYSQGDCGCRSHARNADEDKCLKHNFSEFQKARTFKMSGHHNNSRVW